MAKDDSNEDFTFPTPDSDEFFPPPPPAWWRTSAASRRENPLAARGGGEEKMDMLWEDFNSNEEEDGGELLKLEFVEGLKKLSKPIIIKRPIGRENGILVFMKVLKKVFLLHHS
ncbi:hypothetical protein DM860_013655 [Cuscuta australis]|uniref:Uncharacterized protein n=1 Tax=Cuscuta australis TaxID=267555 RepID=A0A328EED8_9ASTE|nr:hypothetical protein DM860_013655 [Cuscuta australis]